MSVHAADVGERPLHLASLLEDAESCDLRREAFAIFRAVAHPNPEEHDDTGVDLGHALVAHIDLS